MKDSLKTITILFRATHTIEEIIKHDVRNYHLNPTEFGVLEALYHKGPLSIQMIKEKVLIASSSMTYVVDQLSQKNLISKDETIQDKRVSLLTLSQQGLDFMRANYPQHVLNLRTTLDGLTKDEEDLLQTLLKKLGKAQK